MLAARRTALVAAAALMAATTAVAHEPDETPPRAAFTAPPTDAERAGLEAERATIPGADPDTVELGQDVDGDGDADVIHIHLEVIEIQEEVFPGEYVTFWVF